MKIEEIKQWRGCGLLDQFFSIKCASTALAKTTFGGVIDFLLEEINRLETALSGKTQFDVASVTAQRCIEIIRKYDTRAELVVLAIRREFLSD